MKSWLIFTDGSFGDDSLCHGGIVYWTDNGNPIRIHVKCSNTNFTSMRNVGGEILAAWSAIMSVVSQVKKFNEETMDTYELNLVYDYKGVGEWLTGRWKTNKPATRWFVNAINSILNEVPNLKVNYIWVKGHSDNRGNAIADKTAAYDMAYVRQEGIKVCDLDSLIKI